MFKTILFPVDRSREAYEAAKTVAELVQIHNSKLVLLSVVEKTDQEETSQESEGQESEGMSSPLAVSQLLQQTQGFFEQQGIKSEAVEKEGMPAFIICDLADEINADLIIMGCRGLGLTEEGRSESVTNRVINLSPCPVLIIP